MQEDGVRDVGTPARARRTQEDIFSRWRFIMVGVGNLTGKGRVQLTN